VEVGIDCGEILHHGDTENTEKTADFFCSAGYQAVSYIEKHGLVARATTKMPEQNFRTPFSP
jgi:hypothetical protein